jgi:hypothetical protein
MSKVLIIGAGGVGGVVTHPLLIRLQRKECFTNVSE